MEQKVGISLCTRGSAVRVAGSRLCRVSRGTAMIVSPALPLFDLECSDDFEECVVTERMELVADRTAPFFSRIMPMVSTSHPCVTLEQTTADYFVQRARLIAEREKESPPSALFAEMHERILTLMRLELILEVLYKIALAATPSPAEQSRGEQVFVKFIASLADSGAERKSVARYAAEASLSVRYFSSLIHGYTGRTPKQWIAAITVGRAKYLLRQTDLQVKEIAVRLGFPEQFTFRKYFRKNTGISPTHYRKGAVETEH